MLFGVVSASTPWVYSTDDAVPEDTIRITALGSGTPDVRRHQVRVQCKPPLSLQTSARLLRAPSIQGLHALMLSSVIKDGIRQLVIYRDSECTSNMVANFI